VCAAAFGFSFIIAVWPANAAEQPKRIYFLESLSPDLPAGTLTTGAFRSRLNERSQDKFEIFVDYLELLRLPGQAHQDATARFLSDKMREAKPDVVVSLGRAAVPFLQKYRDTIAPDSPVIIASIPAKSAAEASQVPNSVSIVTEYNFAKTLQFARQLQPRARNLVLVAGASAMDRAWADDAISELRPFMGRYDTRYLIGLSYEDTLKELSRLSKDTIVIASVFLSDGSGRSFVGTDTLPAMSEAASAPVYAPFGNAIGLGVVGGYTDSYEAHGIAAADLVIELLSGKPLASLDRQIKAPHGYRVDARQLKRWGLSASNLPAGTTISFQAPDIFEQYRSLILAALAVFVLQTAFVIALLFQRRNRQRAEALLKESEERMTFTAASVNVGLWQLDRETGQLWATEHCRALFGLNNDVPLTRDSLLSAVHPQDRATTVASLRKISEEQGSANADVRVVLPDGQVRWVSVRARVHPDRRGSDSHVTGIFVDVTDQKAAEAEAALQREEVAHLMRVSVLGELSGAMAHEINQPLAAVQSNAETGLDLLSARPPDLIEIRGVLEDIAHDNRRASEVIRRLHTLLKKGERKSEIVDLNELAKSTVALLRTEAINRRANVDLDLARIAPAARGDPVQLQQVLLNLVMNAMDAMAMTPPEHRLVTVSTLPSQDGHVEMVVRDRGGGIPRGDQARLFEPFYTTKARGLGLGLTICSTIIKTHGGTLTLANGEGGGAVARLSLPSQDILAAAAE